MKRNLTLDRFRGMAVILMVAGNALMEAPDAPKFAQHMPDIGLSFADTVAPLFLFAIAVSYRQQFTRLFAALKMKAFSHYACRYLALIGLGTIFSAGGELVSEHTSWGVLQAIGVAGLLTLSVITFPTGIRAAAGLGLLVAYQIALDRFFLQDVLSSSHGGFIGAFSWGAMLILSTVMVDFLQKGIKPFLLSGGALTIIAIISLFIVPISKNRVSLSYVLVSVAICCLWYYLMIVFTKRVPKDYGYVSCWGMNPLLFYVLHLILLGISRIPLALFKVEPTPLWAAALSSIAMLFIIGFIARKKYYKEAVSA
ncbi:MAG: heparan-alpha-glucosaminide N-acetyltransferase domain-containing protein [Clostridia bacterium]|nr:heparan-alpha-glucosaminide N-acetyltransferase domain-containing protein [Clostridia bacterium]